jgi:hypothetical protein
MPPALTHASFSDAILRKVLTRRGAPMTRQPLSPHDKALILQAITWLRIVNDARPAGSPPVYPGAADIDSSALFKRIRAGLTPMPWAPPKRHGQPAYDLIENARGRHAVGVDRSDADGGTLRLDGAEWRILDADPDGRGFHVAYGQWPLAFRLEARDSPRWPVLPEDIDRGDAKEVVRFHDGRLASKDLLRRTRDETVTEWWLTCASPLDEQLYLLGQVLPLAPSEQFRPHAVHRERDGRPVVFDCQPFRGQPLALFAIAVDPWTRVGRYVGVAPDTDAMPRWLDEYDAGRAPCDFLPAPANWHVFELAADGTPLSAWSAPRADALRPLAVE